MTERKRQDMALVGRGLAGVYGVGLLVYFLAFVISFFNYDLVHRSLINAGRFSSVREFQGQVILFWLLFFPQMAAALGVAKGREWGRKLLIGMNGLLLGLVFYKIWIVDHAIDFLSVLTVFFAVFVILFFLQSGVEGFEESPPFPNKRVLIIDDDKILLKMLKKNLANRGFEVLAALNGEEGLRAARRKRPSLIILDVVLPGLMGQEVCERLKENEHTRLIPVIFLTCKASPEDVRVELAAGGISHLTKPVDFLKLLNEIQKVLGTV